MKHVKKELIPIESSGISGDLAYGYKDRKEAKKVLEELTGEKYNIKEFRRVKVMKIIDEGEEVFFWGKECPCCKQKNDGVDSLFYGD